MDSNFITVSDKIIIDVVDAYLTGSSTGWTIITIIIVVDDENIRSYKVIVDRVEFSSYHHKIGYCYDAGVDIIPYWEVEGSMVIGNLDSIN